MKVEKQTVLMIAPTPFFAHRGTHIRILEEARALDQRGHHVTIMTYHIGEDIPKAYRGSIDVKRINRLLFWYKKIEAGPNWQKIILDIMLFRKALFFALSKSPTVIHTHLHEGALIGWCIQKFLFWKKMKLVVDFHGGLTEEMVSHAYLKNSFVKRFFIALERWIDNRGDVALASSSENKESLQSFRSKGTPLHVLSDGVDGQEYRGEESQKKLREQLSLPAHKTILCYTGAFINNKGIQYLLDALPFLQDHSDALHVVFGGYPGVRIEDFVHKHHLESLVSVISPVDYFTLPELLRACDFAVDPKDTTSHQASGKILHYMAAGLPVVCFDRPTNLEVLGDGAFVAQKVSAQSLAERILEALRSPSEIQRKGAVNLEQVQQHTWARVGQQLEEIYAK